MYDESFPWRHMPDDLVTRNRSTTPAIVDDKSLAALNSNRTPAFDVDGERHAVSANEFLAVPAGVVHQLVDVEVPHRSLVVRAPSVRDKLLPER